MLANTITLADDVPANHNYDLVSRSGMNSDRRETGVASNVESVLSIKNTVVLGGKSDTNRHLIRFGWNEVDAVTGELYPCAVHAVITRHKMAPDAAIISKCEEMGNLLKDGTILDDILVGGN